MITAISMPVIIGGAGLAADTIQWSYTKRAMQRQADSGALAGAFALSQSQQNTVAATVTADLSRNNNVAMTIAPVIQTPPTAGAFSGDTRAVRVALATDLRLPFVAFLMQRAIRIPAEATAKVVSQGEYCVLSLENTNVTGINMGGNTNVDLGCGMMSNSPSAVSVTAGGSSRINATPVAAVGGVPAAPSNYAAGTQLIPYSVPQFDPLANLPSPNLAGVANRNGGNVGPNQHSILDPGVYRGGMDLKGQVELRPGIYYIDGGSFSAGSQATVSGTGVVIILTHHSAESSPGLIAHVSINGGATINLTAPTSGTYAGVVFYQDRRALDQGDNKINGNSASRYQGTFYFPGQHVEFTGTSGQDVRCVQIVTRRVTFIGNSHITNVCPPGSGAGSFSGTRVKLVA
ncbi:pilus assembly protein TadG-related protein [Sandarakinorhabdus glacialis]|nr:pilus assembly protein TadG-related protein [Polymorphobacter glacialis]